ncbi:MAG TPA: acyl-CoA dehydratase activase [Clostridia bacterium]|nr:acyl-CoA dehydratase activase [Clostridia bacterium]
MYCGIDLGSRTVKVALLKGKDLFQFKRFVTVDFYRQYGRISGGELVVNLEKLGIAGVTALVTTGYGRQTVKTKGARVISEIKAHVLGAVFKTGLLDFTLLDLGGQDSKVALVRGGRMADFQTNDKCAASTGRYLENMATVLGLSMKELGKYHHDPVKLSATCAIFGETELIGRMVEGHSIPSLAAGVNYTIFKRIRPMLVNLKSSTLVFTGGVAYNEALVTIIKKKLGTGVVVPENPEYAGAIGCCLAARAENENWFRGVRGV